MERGEVNYSVEVRGKVVTVYGTGPESFLDAYEKDLIRSDTLVAVGESAEGVYRFKHRDLQKFEPKEQKGSKTKRPLKISTIEQVINKDTSWKVKSLID